MKTPFLVALSGLAIGFAVPTLAQRKETVDPQVREQIDANIKKSDEAFNNNDAAALAALLTEDAIVVTERGPVFGREPMERYWETEFRYLHFSNHLTKRDPASPHVIGTAGNEVWSTGEWSGTFQGQNGSPVQANAGSSHRYPSHRAERKILRTISNPYWRLAWRSLLSARRGTPRSARGQFP